MGLRNLNPLTDAEIPQSIARDAEVTTAIAAHEAAVNPHPSSGYLTQGVGDNRYRKIVAPETFFDTSNRLISLSPGSGAIATQGAGQGGIEFRAELSGSGPAFLAFHRPGRYATYLGVDMDNQLKIGGWSVNASYRIWNEAQGTPVWQAPSDSRLKRKIRPIESALSFILEAKPVSFEYRSAIGQWGTSEYERKKVHYGFEADKFPLTDLVSTKENGYLGLDYLEITPFLVRAIQESHSYFQSEVEKLKAEIEKLKNLEDDHTLINSF